jgi:hypothetical protein
VCLLRTTGNSGSIGIENHREHDDAPGDHLPDEIANADQDEPVCKDPNQAGTKKGPDLRSLSPGQDIRGFTETLPAPSVGGENVAVCRCVLAPRGRRANPRSGGTSPYPEFDMRTTPVARVHSRL